MKPAIFLDRDGVLIESRQDYVRTREDIVFYPAALKALAKASRGSHMIVIVTNQSGVGRGLIDMDEADAINRHLVIEVQKAGGRIDAVCMCIHTPEQECNCRKPKPGLLLHATGLLGLDLPNSVMIGDAITDLKAGEAAGVGKVALVRTGRGEDQLKMNGEVAEVYKDLAEALEMIF